MHTVALETQHQRLRDNQHPCFRSTAERSGLQPKPRCGRLEGTIQSESAEEAAMLLQQHPWKVHPHGHLQNLTPDVLTVIGTIKMPAGKLPRRMTVVRVVSSFRVPPAPPSTRRMCVSGCGCRCWRAPRFAIAICTRCAGPSSAWRERAGRRRSTSPVSSGMHAARSSIRSMPTRSIRGWPESARALRSGSD
jgi:hypothetical protein